MRTVVSLFLVACASALLVACAASAPTQYTYVRHYVGGRVTRYTYTERDAGAAAQLTAVAELTSFVRDGIGGERIRWIALRDMKGRDLNAQAQALPPYDLSLDPKSAESLRLPKQSVPPGLQGPVDDLLTFFVDLSAKAGIARLHQIGNSYVDPAPLGGDFSSATSPVGRDLIQLTTTLVALNPEQVTFRSSYQPPHDNVLKAYRPWMSAPVCAGQPNNFQLVQAQGPRYIALWGCESFVITTVVKRASGQVISATMVNPLHLKGKLCSDRTLTRCVDIPDTHQQRDVQLKM